MEKREELYRGKAKSVYKTDDANRLILLFRNDTSAFDGKRIEQLDRKGMVNNKFNAFIMQKLEEAGIPTQFDKLLADQPAQRHHDGRAGATERLRGGENADVSARDALVGHGRSFLFVCLAGNITRMNICSVIRP